MKTPADRVRHAFGGATNQMLNMVVQMNFAELEIRALGLELEKYKKIFEEGRDVYREAASELFAVPLDQVTDEMRRMAKTILYGKVYEP